MCAPPGFCWRWSTFGQLFCKAMQHSTERQHKKNGSVQRYIERHPRAQKLKCAICNQQVGGSNPSTSSSSSRTSVRAKAPVEGPGLSSSLRCSSLPRESLLYKLSRGPRQGHALPDGLRSIQKARSKDRAFLIPLRHSSFSPRNFALQIFAGAPAESFDRGLSIFGREE